MGLDMYLEADQWIGGQYEFKDAQGECNISVRVNDTERKDYHFDAKEISSITMRVGYWRKANAIHQWFVQNVQNGIDECQRSWVSRNQLTELKTLCQVVLKHKGEPETIKQILPPQSGFFFGSTAIDEWYYQDMEDTIKIIDEALAKSDELDFYYQASW